ncbi:hypothetical protein BDB00DRAFT_879616 [Zychaea mexicana]|uniref:uncharacterized protein n=1 Tax=Zychaea mexicana TaxID=64656 RepID=UPI0022FEE445|nr:uncharacterized protein BDB00DRAFT_879616 [Zychaea mexicana]KAI9474876.1 hypothetical protein BDB00DRAFT_879616 [Zychaea mexicana]
MHSSIVSRAVHKPLIQFVGSRANLWKNSAHHAGPHPMTPANLEKHVAKPDPVPAQKPSSPSYTAGSVEFGQRPTRYYHTPISEAEMEAIESGGASLI